jgi:excisionase family DNA binding protein
MSNPRPARLGYTQVELARSLGVVPSTVRNWIDRGQISAVHVGRLWLISAAEVERFLAEGATDTEAAS